MKRSTQLGKDDRDIDILNNDYCYCEDGISTKKTVENSSNDQQNGEKKKNIKIKMLLTLAAISCTYLK